MAGDKTGEKTWSEAYVKLNQKSVLIRSLKDLPNAQIMYLRLPDGASHGEGYESSGKKSLKKLYRKKINNITTIDGSATYTLDELKDLVATVLKQRKARDIRVLDYKTTVLEENDTCFDHTDHTVSARLVVEVLNQNKIEGNLTG